MTFVLHLPPAPHAEHGITEPGNIPVKGSGLSTRKAQAGSHPDSSSPSNHVHQMHPFIAIRSGVRIANTVLTDTSEPLPIITGTALLDTRRLLSSTTKIATGFGPHVQINSPDRAISARVFIYPSMTALVKPCP
jgi:hypothetical protein